jgi:multiple sugar transport system permease protein
MRRVRYYAASALLVGVFVALPSFSLILFASARVTSVTLTQPWQPTTQNFTTVFNNSAVRFAFLRTTEIVIVAVCMEIFLGTLFAFMFCSSSSSALAERLFSLPVFASPLAVGIVWKLLFTERGGVVNAALHYFGGPPAHWMSVSTPVTGILTIDRGFALLNANMATALIILADVWQWTPFITIVVIARLSTVPTHVLEAAQVDGLSKTRLIVSVLLPLLRPTLVIVGCVRIVDALKIFDTAWVLFGDSFATATISVMIVEYGLVIRDFGRAAALSIGLLVLASAFAAVLVAYFRRAHE